LWTPDRHFQSFAAVIRSVGRPRGHRRRHRCVPNPRRSVRGAAPSPRAHLRGVVGRGQPLARPRRPSFEGWHDRDFTLNPANFPGRREIMRKTSALSASSGAAIRGIPRRPRQSVVRSKFTHPDPTGIAVVGHAAVQSRYIPALCELGAGCSRICSARRLDDLGRKSKSPRRAQPRRPRRGCVTSRSTPSSARISPREEKCAPRFALLADFRRPDEGLAQARLSRRGRKNLAKEEWTRCRLLVSTATSKLCACSARLITGRKIRKSFRPSSSRGRRPHRLRVMPVRGSGLTPSTAVRANSRPAAALPLPPRTCARSSSS